MITDVLNDLPTVTQDQRASILSAPRRVMKLDWLARRDLTCRDKGVLTSISAEGTPLSDHDCVWCSVG